MKYLSNKDIRESLQVIARARKISKKGKVNLASKLLGTYGELKVAKELLKLGDKKNGVYYRAGQSHFDLELCGKKIEVKTSILKNEGVFPKIRGIGKPFYWGWRLSKKKRKEKFDYIILVALEGVEKRNQFNWRVKHYYILPALTLKDLKRKQIQRFSNVPRGIYLFKKPSQARRIKNYADEHKKTRLSAITEWEIEFNKNYSKYEDNWKLIQI